MEPQNFASTFFCSKASSASISCRMGWSSQLAGSVAATRQLVSHSSLALSLMN